MKPVSEKRKVLNIERAAMLEETFGPREEWFCQFAIYCERFPDVIVRALDRAHRGEVHGHEILKRSRGGSITDPNNVALLCDFHNGWVEDFPLTAMKLGLADHARPISKTTQRINALNKKNHPGEAL
jgi:hypothetical protein